MAAATRVVDASWQAHRLRVVERNTPGYQLLIETGTTSSAGLECVVAAVNRGG